MRYKQNDTTVRQKKPGGSIEIGMPKDLQQDYCLVNFEFLTCCVFVWEQKLAVEMTFFLIKVQGNLV